MYFSVTISTDDNEFFEIFTRAADFRVEFRRASSPDVSHGYRRAHTRSRHNTFSTLVTANYCALFGRVCRSWWKDFSDDARVTQYNIHIYLFLFQFCFIPFPLFFSLSIFIIIYLTHQRDTSVFVWKEPPPPPRPCPPPHRPFSKNPIAAEAYRCN